MSLVNSKAKKWRRYTIVTVGVIGRNEFKLHTIDSEIVIGLLEQNSSIRLVSSHPFFNRLLFTAVVELNYEFAIDGIVRFRK